MLYIYFNYSSLHRLRQAILVSYTVNGGLVLIEPQNFRVRMWRELNPYEGYTQRKTRAIFEYNSQIYRLSITDPVFTRSYCTQHPPEGKPPLEIEPPSGDRCLFCVSLTPPFGDYHYKVVATVLELP